MSNPHRSTITVKLGGVDHDLRLNNTALVEIESELKCSVVDLLAGSPGRVGIGIREAIVIIHAGLKGAGKPVARKALVELIDDMPPGRVLKTAAMAISAAFHDPDANPPGEAENLSAASPGAA